MLNSFTFYNFVIGLKYTRDYGDKCIGNML